MALVFKPVVVVVPRTTIEEEGGTVEESLLLCTRRVSSLSELKCLILSNLGGTGRREIGRVGYRLLALLDNGVFRFRLFWLLGDNHVRLMFDIHGRIMVEQVMELSAEVCDVGSGGSVHSTFVQDDPLLAPPPIQVAIPVEDMEVGEEDSDEEYVTDSNDSDSFEYDDEEEFVPEMPDETALRYVPLLSALSDVSSYYHTLDLDVMHEKSPISNTGKEDYNLDGGVRRVGGAHTCLAPTMSQDHRQLDSGLICNVILSLIQSNPSSSILVVRIKF
ncbi:hypothetical protein Ahy_B09g098833 [Arachis hypogaea]|uniref:Uncharacterized protein n=1 Tax=Arachis hypogaea TaxID=3818 RepID=A0A444XS67_ARAHY|nr:hypothetical protein Ahy_B09g098833 [Arachis hypogaea]